MYEIFPKSLKEFIEDTSIKLPRFQRKATWDDKKRFELALSIFKNYPLGASILSKENSEGQTTDWLLDGRQRRDTIKAIYENPENLYVWGKKYLSIKSNGTIDGLTNDFWKKVSDFIEEEKKAEPSLVQKESGMKDEEERGDDDVEETSSDQKDKKEIANDQEELVTLLNILQIAFIYKTRFQTGLTSSFEFSDYLAGKAYSTAFCGDDKRTACVKLRKFLQEYKDNCSKANKDYKSLDVFISYLDERYDWINDSAKGKLENKLKGEWSNRQLKIIEAFDRIDFIFMNRRIAIIETRDITSTDSQKIFNLINTGGTQLTASEILSAKPKWNVAVKSPSSKYESAIKKLYDKLALDNGARRVAAVKWDIPAASTYFFDEEDDSGFSLFFKMGEDDVANRITVGFKILSGLLTRGVKKEDIDTLSSKMDWENYEDQLQDIKRFFESFKNNVYLGIIKSWGKCLSDIISDGPTMNYIFLLYRSWQKLGKPTGFATEAKRIYDKNAFIELDHMFYGYINNQWRGSSDSTIQRNIAAFESGNGYDSNGLFAPISADLWKETLDGIFKTNLLNGKPITKGALAPLVYFYNCLKTIKGSGFGQPGEIDHIIPQSAWKASSVLDKDSILNNVFNLAALPKDVNASKNDQLLSAIAGNSSIATAVSNYEEIPLEDFMRFSEIANYEELKAMREKLYYEAFGDRRNKILQNS